MAKPEYTPRQLVAVLMIDKLDTIVRDSDEIQYGNASYKKRVQALAVKMMERLAARYKLDITIPDIDSGSADDEDLIG